MAEYEIYMNLLCLGLESRIDFARPRRSPLVRQLGEQRIDGNATMTLIRALSRI